LSISPLTNLATKVNIGMTNALIIIIFPKDYLRYIPDFYKEILQTWIKMGGGQTKTLSHFAEIRKQLIWGNKYIMFKNKSLMFDNWINSDLIYINDILNENGEISQNLILDKLKYKNNWISEFICLKKAIPNEWYHTLQAQNSIKSVVNFQKDKSTNSYQIV
jgi:hypothetical protein